MSRRQGSKASALDAYAEYQESLGSSEASEVEFSDNERTLGVSSDDIEDFDGLGT